MCASATAPLQTLPVSVQRSARWVHLNDTCCNTEVFAMVASKKQHQDYHCVGGSCVELFHNEGCQDIGEECLRDDDCCEGSYCCDYMVCSSIHWIPIDSQTHILTAIYKAQFEKSLWIPLISQHRRDIAASHALVKPKAAARHSAVCTIWYWCMLNCSFCWTNITCSVANSALCVTLQCTLSWNGSPTVLFCELWW